MKEMITVSQLKFQSPTVHLTSISPDGNPAQTPIFLGDTQHRRLGLFADDNVDRIWSCRFSADGKEIIAGGNGRILGLFSCLEEFYFALKILL